MTLYIKGLKPTDTELVTKRGRCQQFLSFHLVRDSIEIVTVLNPETGPGWEWRRLQTHTHAWMRVPGGLCAGTQEAVRTSAPVAPHPPHVVPICSHIAEKERNARTITTATEPRPAPTICCSVSDESFT